MTPIVKDPCNICDGKRSHRKDGGRSGANGIISKWKAYECPDNQGSIKCAVLRDRCVGRGVNGLRYWLCWALKKVWSAILECSSETGWVLHFRSTTLPPESAIPWEVAELAWLVLICFGQRMAWET